MRLVEPVAARPGGGRLAVALEKLAVRADLPQAARLGVSETRAESVARLQGFDDGHGRDRPRRDPARGVGETRRDGRSDGADQRQLDGGCEQPVRTLEANSQDTQWLRHRMDLKQPRKGDVPKMPARLRSRTAQKVLAIHTKV